MTETLALPRFEDATVVVPAPGAEPGNWSGAASAVLVDGIYWLTYRVRRPLVEGRGVSVVVARSEDGEHFVTVAEVRRAEFRAESFERPVLVRRPDGGWRLYVSCATPGSKHWWIEAVDADEPAGLETGVRTVVLPGTDSVAVKDPVVLVDETGWRMWVCVHPLTEPGHEDRMTTTYATSADGLAWDWHGTVLAPSAGSWDQRGTRVTTDGRPPRTTGTRPRVWPGPPTGARWSPRRGRCCARRTATAPCATSRPCRCPTAAPGSTSRRPAPTERTT
jgi:hypothetical protein